jgi:hypothetical protein
MVFFNNHGLCPPIHLCSSDKSTLRGHLHFEEIEPSIHAVMIRSLALFDSTMNVFTNWINFRSGIPFISIGGEIAQVAIEWESDNQETKEQRETKWKKLKFNENENENTNERISEHKDATKTIEIVLKRKDWGIKESWESNWMKRSNNRIRMKELTTQRILITKWSKMQLFDNENIGPFKESWEVQWKGLIRIFHVQNDGIRSNIK